MMTWYQKIYQDGTLYSVYTQDTGLGPISALPLTGCLILLKLLDLHEFDFS